MASPAVGPGVLDGRGSPVHSSGYPDGLTLSGEHQALGLSLAPPGHLAAAEAGSHAAAAAVGDVALEGADDALTTTHATPVVSGAAAPIAARTECTALTPSPRRCLPAAAGAGAVSVAAVVRSSQGRSPGPGASADCGPPHSGSVRIQGPGAEEEEVEDGADDGGEAEDEAGSLQGLLAGLDPAALACIPRVLLQRLQQLEEERDVLAERLIESDAELVALRASYTQLSQSHASSQSWLNQVLAQQMELQERRQRRQRREALFSSALAQQRRRQAQALEQEPREPLSQDVTGEVGFLEEAETDTDKENTPLTVSLGPTPSKAAAAGPAVAAEERPRSRLVAAAEAGDAAQAATPRSGELSTPAAAVASVLQQQQQQQHPDAGPEVSQHDFAGGPAAGVAHTPASRAPGASDTGLPRAAAPESAREPGPAQEAAAADAATPASAAGDGRPCAGAAAAMAEGAGGSPKMACEPGAVGSPPGSELQPLTPVTSMRCGSAARQQQQQGELQKQEQEENQPQWQGPHGTAQGAKAQHRTESTPTAASAGRPSPSLRPRTQSGASFAVVAVLLLLLLGASGWRWMRPAGPPGGSLAPLSTAFHRPQDDPPSLRPKEDPGVHKQAFLDGGTDGAAAARREAPVGGAAGADNVQNGTMARDTRLELGPSSTGADPAAPASSSVDAGAADASVSGAADSASESLPPASASAGPSDKPDSAPPDLGGAGAGTEHTQRACAADAPAAAGAPVSESAQTLTLHTHSASACSKLGLLASALSCADPAPELPAKVRYARPRLAAGRAGAVAGAGGSAGASLSWSVRAAGGCACRRPAALAAAGEVPLHPRSAAVRCAMGELEARWRHLVQALQLLAAAPPGGHGGEQGAGAWMEAAPRAVAAWALRQWAPAVQRLVLSVADDDELPEALLAAHKAVALSLRLCSETGDNNPSSSTFPSSDDRTPPLLPLDGLEESLASVAAITAVHVDPNTRGGGAAAAARQLEEAAQCLGWQAAAVGAQLQAAECGGRCGPRGRLAAALHDVGVPLHLVLQALSAAPADSHQATATLATPADEMDPDSPAFDADAWLPGTPHLRGWLAAAVQAEHAGERRPWRSLLRAVGGAGYGGDWRQLRDAMAAELRGMPEEARRRWRGAPSGARSVPPRAASDVAAPHGQPGPADASGSSGPALLEDAVASLLAASRQAYRRQYAALRCEGCGAAAGATEGAAPAEEAAAGEAAPLHVNGTVGLACARSLEALVSEVTRSGASSTGTAVATAASGVPPAAAAAASGHGDVRGSGIWWREGRGGARRAARGLAGALRRLRADVLELGGAVARVRELCRAAAEGVAEYGCGGSEAVWGEPLGNRSDGMRRRDLGL